MRLKRCACLPFGPIGLAVLGALCAVVGVARGSEWAEKVTYATD